MPLIRYRMGDLDFFCTFDPAELVAYPSSHHAVSFHPSGLSPCPAWPSRSHPDERLDGDPLVHRPVRLSDVVEVSFEIEDASRVDAPFEDVVEQFRDVGARGGDASPQADVAKNDCVGNRSIDPMGDADHAGHRSRPSDG